jgi:hypothetical protein
MPIVAETGQMRIVEIPVWNQARKFLTIGRTAFERARKKFAGLHQRVTMAQNNGMGMT